MSRMSAATGCVEGRRSCWIAPDFSEARKVTQASFHRVFFTAARWLMNSAKDSLSHRSSHHFIVTRSPNHMCACSWRIVMTRRSMSAPVGFVRKM